MTFLSSWVTGWHVGWTHALRLLTWTHALDSRPYANTHGIFEGLGEGENPTL